MNYCPAKKTNGSIALENMWVGYLLKSTQVIQACVKTKLKEFYIFRFLTHTRSSKDTYVEL